MRKVEEVEMPADEIERRMRMAAEVAAEVAAAAAANGPEWVQEEEVVGVVQHTAHPRGNTRPTASAAAGDSGSAGTRAPAEDHRTVVMVATAKELGTRKAQVSEQKAGEAVVSVQSACTKAHNRWSSDGRFQQAWVTVAAPGAPYYCIHMAAVLASGLLERHVKVGEHGMVQGGRPIDRKVERRIEMRDRHEYVGEGKSCSWKVHRHSSDATDDGHGETEVSE
jgi:hypothetical protein